MIAQLRSRIVENVLPRPLKVASCALFGGISFLLIAHFLLSGVWAWLSEENYVATGVFSAIFSIALLSAGVFLLGAYWGAGFLWLKDDVPRDYSPTIVAVSSLFGLIMGYFIGVWVFVADLAWAIAALLIAFFMGAYGTYWKWKKWNTQKKRFAHLLTQGILILAGMALVLQPQAPFPGSQAPLDQRRTWALAVFGNSYQKAESYLSQSKQVKENLGKIVAIAPTTGPNRTVYSPGELMGEFTLEIQGQKGAGIASLKFMHGSASAELRSYGFNGTLLRGAELIQLPRLP